MPEHSGVMMDPNSITVAGAASGCSPFIMKSREITDFPINLR